MGYYHIRLSEYSNNPYNITLTWGECLYKRLPMGVSNSPDIFQEKMEKIFCEIEFVWAYIDDLLIISKSD